MSFAKARFAGNVVAGLLQVLLQESYYDGVAKDNDAVSFVQIIATVAQKG